MLNQKKYEILPLYIDYGHKSVQMEIKSLMKICYELKLEPKIIKLSEYSKKLMDVLNKI